MNDTVLVKFAGIAKEFSVSKILDLGFTEVRWYGAISDDYKKKKGCFLPFCSAEESPTNGKSTWIK